VAKSGTCIQALQSINNFAFNVEAAY